MPKKYQNFDKFYKSVNSIYNAILISYLFFMTIAYAMTKDHHFSFEKIDIKILLLDIFAGLIVFLLAGFIKKSLYKCASKISGIKEKLKLFLKYYLINLAIVEVYGLLNSFGYLQTHNLVFMFFGGYALLLLLLMKPKPEKMSYLLKLSPSEQEYIQDTLKIFD